MAKVVRAFRPFISLNQIFSSVVLQLTTSDYAVLLTENKVQRYEILNGSKLLNFCRDVNNG